MASVEKEDLKSDTSTATLGGGTCSSSGRTSGRNGQGSAAVCCVTPSTAKQSETRAAGLVRLTVLAEEGWLRGQREGRSNR